MAAAMHLLIVTALVATLTMVAVGMFRSGLGPGYQVLFSWHPVLMTAAFVYFMGSAMHSYRVEQMPKVHRRKVHAVHNVLMLCAAIGGYYAIFKSHADKGKSQFGKDAPTWLFVHVWLGYGALALVLVQVLVGVMKLVKVQTKGQPTMKWHGHLGRLTFFAGLVNVAIGIKTWSTWSAGFKAVCYILTAMSAVGVLLPGFLLPPPRHARDAPVGEALVAGGVAA